MTRAAVDVRVAGHSYRVVTSAPEADLQRLAAVVDAKLRELAGPGRPVAPQTLLLAALALAHEVEVERERRQQVEQRAREMLSHVLERLDAALDTPASPVPPTASEQPQG